MMPALAEAFVIALKWVLVALICFGVGYRLLGAWFERELAGWEVVLLLCGLLFFVVTAIALSNSPWFFALLAGVLLLWGTTSIIPRLLVEKARREMLKADLERFRRALDFDPKNVAAYAFLADVCAKLGDLEGAIENYRKALELDPKLIEEKVRLEQALREKARQEGRAMFCPRCQQPRAPRQDACLECGRFFSFNETIAFNLQRLPRARLYLFIAAAPSAILFALVLASTGLAWLALVLILAALGFGIKALRQLARWQ